MIEMDKFINFVFIVTIITFGGAAVLMGHTLVIKYDYDNYCVNNGYDSSSVYQLKNINDIEYVKCLGLKDVNGTIVEFEEWIRWE